MASQRFKKSLEKNRSRNASPAVSHIATHVVVTSHNHDNNNHHNNNSADAAAWAGSSTGSAAVSPREPSHTQADSQSLTVPFNINAAAHYDHKLQSLDDTKVA